MKELGRWAGSGRGDKLYTQEKSKAALKKRLYKGDSYLEIIFFIKFIVTFITVL